MNKPRLFTIGGVQVEADVDGLPKDKEKGHYLSIDTNGQMYRLDYQGSSWKRELVTVREEKHGEILKALES